MGETPEEHLLALVRQQVAQAIAGSTKAAVAVLFDCEIALRSLVEHGAFPDAVRIEALRFLHGALVEILEQSKDPRAALRLTNPDNRPPNESLAVRDAALFATVGQQIDALLEKGETRQDKPTEKALLHVAKQWGLSVETVTGAWRKYKSFAGWKRVKSDWK